MPPSMCRPKNIMLATVVAVAMEALVLLVIAIMSCHSFRCCCLVCYIETFQKKILFGLIIDGCPQEVSAYKRLKGFKDPTQP